MNMEIFHHYFPAQYWNFAGILFILALASIQTRVGSLLLILLSLPSTILHELAHAIAAIITGGRIVTFSLIPRRFDTDSGKKVWVLGHVIAEIGVFSASPFAVAPLLCLPAAYLFSRNAFSYLPESIGGALLFYWGIYILIRASFLSSTDIKVLTNQPKSTILYLSLLVLIYFNWNFIHKIWALYGL